MATSPSGTRPGRSLRAILTATVSLTGLLSLPGAAWAGSDGPAGLSVSELVEAQTLQGGDSTPEGALDPNDVTGVGQLVVDFGFGSSTCTASLINPRTILFAAHCVNTKVNFVLDPATGQYVTVPTGIADPTGYGAGGIALGFGVRADNRPGFSDFTNPASANYHRTALGNMFYNISQVAYHPNSVAIAEATGDLNSTFYQGDIAVATLDTPAAGVPTWAMLFSPLPPPGTISDTDGTGYHVSIGGYGLSGNGVDGAYQQVDYRRRIAENMIGIFGSFDDLDVTFGNDPTGLSQSLYFLDFDDPSRESPNDTNVFKDDARPNEGITAPGDSGGPLILDETFSDQVILGVLSGGSSGGPGFPPGSYGSLSFYQPLFLYWDWIAANNPYHYVNAKGGDGAWEDPNHWVTVLDPSYRVIDAKGNLVNGIPDTPGAGLNPIIAPYGQVCQQSRADDVDLCYDLRTKKFFDHGEEVLDVEPQGSEEALAALRARAEASGDPLVYVPPVASLANGLPGATGFTPDNRDPDVPNGVKGSYFDVTLSLPGTTTLSSDVTVDRFALGNNAARLDIREAGSLTSLMNITQFAGEIIVDGRLASVGDFMLVSGLLRGEGTIAAPYVTNMMGTIAPGGAGTVGTLNIDGNVVLASKSILAIDIGPNGASDTLVIGANDDAGVDGIASVGGQVALLPTPDTRVRYGDTFRILTAEGGVTERFSGVNSFSAILKSAFVYTANAVDVRIDAASYNTVIDPQSPVQRSYATLLDQDRSRSAELVDLYDALDMQTPDRIRASLEGLAPSVETLKTAVGIAATENAAALVSDRLIAISSGNAGGKLTLVGQPVRLAHALNGRSGSASPATATDSVQEVVPANLPDDMSAVLSVGYIDGSAARMTGMGGTDDFSGFSLAAGVEKLVGATSAVGLAVSYTDLDGDSVNGKAKGQHFAGTIYGRFGTGALALDGRATLGRLSSDTSRSQSPLATGTLRSESSATTFSGEVGVSGTLRAGALSLEPRAAFRGEHIGFSDVDETGGVGALGIQRDAFTSLEGRASVTVAFEGNGVRPFATATLVNRFNDPDEVFLADFVDGIGVGAPFALTSWDRSWGELRAGVRAQTGALDFALSGQVTVGRDDVRTSSATGRVAFRF
ncbi:autotransporter domain-containing protein [Sphingomonas desiccabilis]|uniref:Autotransporter domain-containing protein n=1 Tax=Sphingomonas desiccabilis TaxID=429134 RepID=A0A4Q2IQC9_9SPHN|nr:autotransporter domain-containing protein [Sphingomonas desiccabilis]MBB3912097.1 outer membrane autotransporter protein [Sphingomonas desiccabilis]RXZ30265.1 autotransporter domain-containing protein [Sphingomonas desiccabilis]